MGGLARAAAPAFRFPGGRVARGAPARVVAALPTALAGRCRRLVVCHGGTIRCAIAARRPGLGLTICDASPNGVLLDVAAARR